MLRRKSAQHDTWIPQMNKNSKLILAGIVGLAACSTLIGLMLSLMSTVYMAASANAPSAEYFITISELVDKKEATIGRDIRVSGAVIGDSIVFDESSRILTFLIADVPGDHALVEKQGGLAKVLETAVNDPDRLRLQISYQGEMPELLRDMAQAIITGELKEDGVFYAIEILLRCPSRYEESVPEQAVD